MKIINLGSGSKGNATLVKIEEGYILIDCGLTRFEKLLKEHNISLDEIKYVFITHCHGDHVLNIYKFSGDIIYCGEETISLPHNVLEPYETYEIGSFKVTPLKTSHDAPDSMGYLFNIDGSQLPYANTNHIYARNGQYPKKNLSDISGYEITCMESAIFLYMKYGGWDNATQTHNEISNGTLTINDLNIKGNNILCCKAKCVTKNGHSSHSK